MRLQNILTEFLKFIIRSIVFSAIVFSLSFSLLTRQFPPDFSKLAKIYDQLAKLKIIDSDKSTGTKALDPNRSETDELQSLIEQKQKLSQILSEMNIFDLAKNETWDLKDPKCLHEQALINQLKDKIKALDEQNLNLNKKILQIKYKRQ